MAKTRKTPIRTCCVCGEKQGKQGLVRFVRTPDGVVKLDPRGREAGRGAYLCARKDCFDKAHKQRRLDKALRVSLNEDDYGRLARDFAALLSEPRSVQSAEGAVEDASPAGEGMVG